MVYHNSFVAVCRDILGLFIFATRITLAKYELKFVFFLFYNNTKNKQNHSIRKCQYRNQIQVQVQECKVIILQNINQYLPY